MRALWAGLRRLLGSCSEGLFFYNKLEQMLCFYIEFDYFEF